MSPEMTLWLYFIAAATAGAALFILRAKAWYLHVTALLLGLMAGLMPPLGDDPDLFYLIAGCGFLFFSVWGLGGILLRRAPPLRDARESDITPAVQASRSATSSSTEPGLSSPRVRAAR
jgi:hypothetical protein